MLAAVALVASQVFGAPIEKDGVTVVPVATVSGGGGGGAGSGATKNSNGSEAVSTGQAPAQGEGSGGGFGFSKLSALQSNAFTVPGTSSEHVRAVLASSFGDRSDGSFTVREGHLAFAPGSSGWVVQGRQTRWMELFLRDGNAWELFGRPQVGARIKIG